jgi:tetraacyldisaccharide 4'-kinase
MPGMLGGALEPVYRAAVARRNRAFDAGRGVERLGVPVISIGNLSVGGTGKTPMVMWVVERARDRGMRPAIAMRGYGAKRDGVSDEQAEYAARFPEVVIVAQPDRLAGLRRRAGAYDCVVLDDGFQHRRIARDLDIVLMDATRDGLADRCLPAGWLREPVESVARADAVVFTRADLVEEDEVDRMERRVRVLAPGAVIGHAAHRWTGLVVEDAARGSRDEGVAWLTGKRVVLACGIGHPEALALQVERAGATIVQREFLRDHALWTGGEISRVGAAARDADAVIVTEKDWVKLRGRDLGWGVPVVRPRVAMDLGASAVALGALVDRAIGRGDADTIGA